METPIDPELEWEEERRVGLRPVSVPLGTPLCTSEACPLPKITRRRRGARPNVPNVIAHEMGELPVSGGRDFVPGVWKPLNSGNLVRRY